VVAIPNAVICWGESAASFPCNVFMAGFSLHGRLFLQYLRGTGGIVHKDDELATRIGSMKERIS
jgi:hypothetical protein